MTNNLFNEVRKDIIKHKEKRKRKKRIKKFIRKILYAAVPGLIVSLALFGLELYSDEIQLLKDRNVDRFYSGRSFVPYLDYEDFGIFKTRIITEKKTTDGMRELLSHTFDKYTRVEFVVFWLVVDYPVDNLVVKLKEYQNLNYNPTYAYRPDELNNLPLEEENTIIIEREIPFGTFSNDRVVAIPVAITEPKVDERDIDVKNEEYFNSLKRLAVACHVDFESKVIGTLEYDYKGNHYIEYILDMQTVNLN